MTHATIPGDCIDRVTSQNGDRVLCERLETPRPTPKVTLKQNWQSQRAAFHSSSDTDVPSFWRQGSKREDQGGAQGVTDHSTEADLAHRKLEHTTSNNVVDTHVGDKEVSTHALFKNEAVKEEVTKTPWAHDEELDGVGSTYDEHFFVSLRFDAPVLAHCVDDLPLHFICFAQKKKNTALTCGRNTSTKQKTHFGGPKRTEEENLRRSGIDGKMMRPTGSLSLPKIWSDAWVRYLDHNAQNDISHKAAQEQRSKYTIYFISEVLTKIDRHHLYQQDQGTKKQRLH